jgi:putative transcriptional regulator
MLKISPVVINTPDTEPFHSLRGQLLIATPSLSDGTFDHSVIFIAEHTEKDGAVGAIINHPIGITVGSLVSQLKKSPLSKLPVLQGGPIATEQLTFSSLTWDVKKQQIAHTRISVETAEHTITEGDQLIQAIVGHSGWVPGQLEDEIQRNTWIPLKPTANLLTQTHDINLWKRLLSSISPYHALLSQAPKNPMLN